MATIRLTPEMLREKAAALRQQRESHDDALAGIKSLIDNLGDIFSGAAFEAVVNNFESVQQQSAKFSQALESYAVMVETAANTFEQGDSSLAGQLQL